LNFRIRRNIQTAETLKEIEPDGAPAPQMELGLEKAVVSPEDREQIDKIAAAFSLSAKQVDALADYVARDGIGYLIEKAEIVRSQPRENAARSFIAALRDDWKKPMSIKVGENKETAEKVKAREEAARRKNAEQEAERIRKNAEWEKDQSRIQEYLASLSPEERLGVEARALETSPLGRGQISQRLKQSIIDQYILATLDEAKFVHPGL
jgi:hypothetical protein